MAWVTEYDATWRSANNTGSIYIKRDGGSYISPLTLRQGSLEIQNTVPNWEDPIARMNCSFTIINDNSDFYDLLPLMTIEDGEYQITVTNDTTGDTLFVGYINCEAVDQDMMNFADLTITASGLLSKLDNNHPTSVDTLQYISLIDLIDDCLELSGVQANILVSCDLYEVTVGDITDTTLFNQTAVWTETFWTNNIERMSALQILTTILRTFNCYLIWGNQLWRIEHYQNLNTDRHYVYYYTGTSYGLGDTGIQTDLTITQQPIWNNSNFEQVGDSQRLTIIPGLHEFEIKLNGNLMSNLFYPDLTDIVKPRVNTGLPWDRRTWYAQESVTPNVTWAEEGEPYKDIVNSIRRNQYNITAWDNQLNGITSRFSATVTADSVIVISFKFGMSNWAGWKEDYDSAYEENASDMKITFYWYLSNYVYPGARDFYVYDSATDIWSEVVAGDPDVNGFNTLEISVADLDNDLGTYSGTLKIRIGEVLSDSSGDVDNMDFVFRMGTEDRDGFPAAQDFPFVDCYYGDFNCAVNGTKVNNYYSGVITTDFLNKQSLTLDVYDGIWQNRGALVVPDTIEYLTSVWADANAPSVTDSLVRFLMAYKFRLYRKARQVITMDISMKPGAVGGFNLMYPFVDSKQSNKVFMLLSTIAHLEEDSHTLKLYEYDDTEEINLT